MKFTTLLIFFIFTLSGCAHVMNDDIKELQVTPLPYEEIRENSSKHLGKIVILGGVISTATNSADGGQIELLQYPLTEEGYPDETKGSAGRFLATSPTLLELEKYLKGSLMTVIGEVKSERDIASKWETTRMPVLSIRKAHVWQPEGKKPQPFLIPGTNRVDPYYSGYSTPLNKRPLGIKTDIW